MFTMKYALLILILLSISKLFSQSGQTRFYIQLHTLEFPHTSYLGSESVTPFIINQIQTGLNTRIKPVLSCSVKSNSGNALVHNTALVSKSGGILSVAYDAIFEKNIVHISYPLNTVLEGFVEIGVNSSSERGVYNPLSWLVRDKFIENVHSLFGKEDIYKRKSVGYDRFINKAINEEGQLRTSENNSILSTPLVIGCNYYLKLKKLHETL